MSVTKKKLNLIIKKQYKVFGSCNQSNGTRDFKNIKAGDAQEEDELLELVSQEEQEDDVNVEIIPKLRLLIVKIRSSPQQKEKFARRCKFFSIQSLNVILDVKTRWNSTYLMLDRALKLREVSSFII